MAMHTVLLTVLRPRFVCGVVTQATRACLQQCLLACLWDGDANFIP
jgi:hypothetical protein